MTNYEWLLQMGGEERQAWSDAEHVDDKHAMTNLEWLYENDRDAIIDNLCCHEICDECAMRKYGRCGAIEVAGKQTFREWLLSEHYNDEKQLETVVTHDTDRSNDENATSKNEIRDFDVWSVAYEIYCAGGWVDNGSEPNPPTDGIWELINKQAAITEREVRVSQSKFEFERDGECDECDMEYHTEGMMRGWWVCSKCGKAMDTIESCGGRKPPKVCGNCGAKVKQSLTCRKADENAAAFADAPTLQTAREPMQTPVFELGA